MAERGNGDPSDLTVLTEKVIGAAIEVHRKLGAGFQEITYHRAMMIELEHRGIGFEAEYPVRLKYRGQDIGEGRVDLLVEHALVVELKSAEANPEKYKRQVVSYLKATGLKIGLLLNFNVQLMKDGVARVSL
ncbi:MAG: GxxExxY protein [Planctomycetota bacterium]